MIRKIIFSFILIILFFFTILLGILSKFGIETNRFNNIITEKVTQTQNINLELNKIKFKLDFKELSLFLETKNPKIRYSGILIPTKNIRVYINFLQLLKANLDIKKINVSLAELDIVELNELSTLIKPSNLKSLLNNKTKSGKLIAEIDIFLNNEGLLKNYIVKGKVENLKIEIINNFNLEKTKLNFFADKEDILIKNISGKISDIKIDNGDIKLNLANGIKLNSNFNSEVYLDQNFFKKNSKVLNKLNLSNKIKLINGNFLNTISIDFDNTYKIKDYSYDISGKITKANYKLDIPLKNSFLSNEIKQLYLSDLNINSKFSPKKFLIKSTGNYSLNNKNFTNFNLENYFKDDLLKFKLNADFKDSFEISLINYKKKKTSVANLTIDMEKRKENINFKKIEIKNDEDFFKLDNLIIKNKEFVTFKRAEIKTFNNDFSISVGKKIFIKGNKFDGSNLAKFLNKKEKKKELKFENINSDIEINFKNIAVPMSEKLYNFKLIGAINNGKFVKISSKGDFGGDNFLDISMKKDKNSNKKYLEIFSDLPRPLLSGYSFFDGLSGGKLLFTSLIDESKSTSKLKIENFKVVNAPGLIKLLSLADLRGLEDLAKGDGLSFDILEIDLEKDKNLLKLNEIIALGPSVSVLMDGYQNDKGMTSLRGTLVPAKTLNKFISKIPVIGNIVIPKEIGEGLFGISFKMKGPKGKIKTTINPIRTLTPRFIQKIIEKNKVKE